MTRGKQVINILSQIKQYKHITQRAEVAASQDVVKFP